MTTALLKSPDQSTTDQSTTDQSTTDPEAQAVAEMLERYRADWCLCGKELFGAKLDPEQNAVLKAVQHNRKVSVRSGHARGKDYLMALGACIFLYIYSNSKVILTAPSGRQVVSIMMAEVSRIISVANVRLQQLGFPEGLGGEVQTTKVAFDDDRTHYLLAFKAADRTPESWTGFHAPNIFVGVSEATGVEDKTFDAIDGLLTGNSRLLLVFNPTRKTGFAYKSSFSKEFKSFCLSCLDAPNVKYKKILIPGQVDWEWINERVLNPVWCTPITMEEFDKTKYDFVWEGNAYRPGDLFRVKVLGQFPKQSPGSLIPASWVLAANDRWRAIKFEDDWITVNALSLGVDVAGMGADRTVFCLRSKMVVHSLQEYMAQGTMTTTGWVKSILDLNEEHCAYPDTIGEGAGVHSRLVEQDCNSVSAKFSEGVEYLTDESEERKFLNMRAYCYYAIRDALDPTYSNNLALPPDDELFQELTELKFEFTSSGKMKMEPKDKLKERIGRSPDKADALALSFYPYGAGVIDMV